MVGHNVCNIIIGIVNPIINMRKDGARDPRTLQNVCPLTPTGFLDGL